MSERVVIKVRHNGPLKVTGPVTVVDGQGNELDLEPHTKFDSIVLCRCGQSRAKPFCDQSHLTCGFEPDGPRAPRPPAT